MYSLSEGMKRDACCLCHVHAARDRGLGNGGLVRWRWLWEVPVQGGFGKCLSSTGLCHERETRPCAKPLPSEGLLVTAA